MKHTLSCLLFVCGLLMATVFVVGACESITRHRAVQIEASERTEQTRIIETQATERTLIMVDGNVEIARIQADTAKKTDFTFVIFYLIRAGIWVLGALVLWWVILLAIDLYQYHRG